MYHIFFIHLSVDGHLGCFHDLAIVHSAAMNIDVHVSFWFMVFSGYMPSSGITGSGSFLHKHAPMLWPSHSWYLPKRNKSIHQCKDLYTHVHSSFIFIIDKNRIQSQNSSSDEINKLQYIHNTEYYSVIKMNELLIY